MSQTEPRLHPEVNENGYYEIRWSEQLADGTWRSRRKSTKCTQMRPAQNKLTEFLAEREFAVSIGPKTVNDVLDAYISLYSTPRGNETTDNYNARALRIGLGDHRAEAISQPTIDAYIDRRTGGLGENKPVKHTTAAREINLLQAALNWASKYNVITPGKSFRFTKPPKSEPRVLWLNEEQEQEVISRLSEASHSVQLFTHMGLNYGPRSGAMMQLQFAPQVNWINQTIDFNQPNARRTRKRRAVVPFVPVVRKLLEIRRQETNSNLVLDRQTVKHYNKFMTDIGYGWCTPHVLKHTAVTLMINAGSDVQDIADLTATDVNTLRNVYRHFLVQDLAKVAGSRRA